MGRYDPLSTQRMKERGFKSILFWSKALLIALLTALLIHTVAFRSILVPTAVPSLGLLAGDRVLINKWSYGLRTPSLFGLIPSDRLRAKPVLRGDLLLFNTPQSEVGYVAGRELLISCCAGIPGDTLYFTTHIKEVPHAIVVPARNMRVRINQDNIQLIAQTITRHEGKHTFVAGKNLFVNGVLVANYQFIHNYYWMRSPEGVPLADSQQVGYVPEDHLIGKAVCVGFSKQVQASWWKGYRWERTFKLIKQ